jgi:hypothetical protein
MNLPPSKNNRQSASHNTPPKWWCDELEFFVCNRVLNEKSSAAFS